MASDRGPLRAAAAVAGVLGALALLGVTGAAFSGNTASTTSLVSGTMDPLVPTAVTASRTSSTACTVSWTPASGAPGATVYDVTDGQGTTLASAVSGTSTSVTVTTAQILPTVRSRRGLWVSAAQATAASPGCTGVPGAPTAVAASTGDATSSVSWAAPASDGGSSVTSYTATATPSDGTLATRTCSAASSPCSLTGLTNGATYTVSVTATNAVGTGPASGSATVIPYPSGVMSTSALRLWLDGADSSTMHASSGCSGASATTSLGCWRDKSGQSDHAVQVTGGNQPALASMSGRSVPGFDGTAGHLALAAPSSLPTGTTSSTEFVVARLADADPSAAGRRSVLDWGADATGQARSLFKVSGSAAAHFDARSTGASTPGSWSTTGPTLLAAEAAGAGTTLRTALNGDSWTSPTSVSFSTGTTSGFVGQSVGGTNRWNGPVGEAIVVTGTMSGADRRTVEEYLARKWGMVITPQAPMAPGTTPGDTQALVSWTAPAWTGGAAVSSYTVTAVPSDGSLPTRTCAAASSPCTVTGLTNGVTYTVTVTATNSAGTGPASTSATVIPYPAGVMSAAALQVWLDAMSDSTLFTDSAGTTAATTGSGIGRWADRSGHGMNATVGSGAGKPVLTASAINGRQGLRFVRTNPDWLEITASGVGALGSADRSLFVVGTARTTQDNSTNSYGGMLTWPGYHNGIQAYGYPNATFAEAPAWTSTNTYVGASGSVSWPAILAQVGSTSGGTITTGGYGNGATLGTTSAASSSWRSYSDLVRIGTANVSPATQYLAYLDGDVGEILVINRAVTVAERREVEEYLARKWAASITPQAPGTPSGTAGNGQVSVSWSAPSWNGGAAVTGYTVTASPGGATCSTASTSCTVSGLTNGTAYTFTVTAVNSVGTGPASSASGSVTPIGPPGAATGVAASAGDTTSGVSWTAPASTGGSAITGYTATAVPSDGGLPTRTCSAASSPCTLVSLTDGVTYTVSVTATNVAGTGSASSSVTVIPYPSGVMSSSAMKLWLDGADAATMYAGSTCTSTLATTTVGCWKDKSTSTNNASQSTSGNRPTLATVNGRSVPGFDGSNDTLSATASMLPNGTSTSSMFVVGKLTDPTPTSSSFRTVFEHGTASSGQSRIIEKQQNSAAVSAESFGSVVSDGTWGSAAQVVGAQWSSGVMTLWNSSRPAVSSTPPINTGTTYATVGSENGNYYWMGPIPEIIVLNTAPSNSARREIEEYLARKWAASITPQAPGTPTGTAGNGQVGVSWSAPSWSGGAAVTGYTVTASPGGATCSTASTSCTVSGLTNGTAYTFTVTAANSVGTGPASSASGSVTPIGPPGAPTAVAASAGDTTSSVSWTAPASTGGSAITGYTVSAVPSDGGLPTRTCSAASSPCSVAGLTDGVTYAVSVTATNAVGTGSASSSVTVIPYPSGVMSTNLVLWLDGADTSTMFASSACSGAAATTSLGCWTDKSAQANHATQATGGNQPGMATVNGRSVPSLNGSSGYLSLNVAKLPTARVASTIVAASMMTDASAATSGWRDMITWGTNSTGQKRMLGKNNSAAAFDTAGSGYTSPGNWPYNSTAIVIAQAASATTRSSMNGTPYGSATSYDFVTGTSSAVLGRALGGSNYWLGRMPEVMVFSSTLTTAERRSVEEYLARKWAVVITPQAPTGVAASPASSTSASISWTAPAWNGGASVTGYTATASPGGATCTSASTSCTITGLTSGASYTVTVTATNSVGIGPASSGAGVTLP